MSIFFRGYVKFLHNKPRSVQSGFMNLCQQFGSVKNISIHNNNRNETVAFIEFEAKDSVDNILKDKSIFPPCITVDLTSHARNEIKSSFDDIVIENTEVQNLANECFKTSHDNSNDVTELIATNSQSVYFGPDVYGQTLIDKAYKEKCMNKTKLFNLENDDIFGKPLNRNWEKVEKPVFQIHSLDFHKRFENCDGGEIQIGKKLSRNMFTGWVSNFNNSENVLDSLKSISIDIEKSNVLNLSDVQAEMLVGAFDIVTNSFARGYVVFVAGNSANVVLCDYGRAINTANLRTLPNCYSSVPIYSFKAFTRGDHVPLLKKSHTFKIKSVNADRIVLLLFVESQEVKIQLKTWRPTVEEYGVPCVNIKSGSKVELLKLKDMNTLYIRSKEKSHFNFFFMTWNNLAAYCYKNGKSLDREPFYGEIVAFKSRLCNDNFVRGRICTHLGSNVYIVRHMDNPLKEIINLSEMIELKFEHKFTPVCYLKVGMLDALSYPVNGYGRDFINHIIGHNLTVYFDEENNSWQSVELHLSVLKENINIILRGLVLPTWLKQIQINPIDEVTNICKYDHLIENELFEKSIVSLTFVLFHDGVFYMRDRMFGKSFSTLSNMIKEYCSLNSSPYFPRIDEVCLGQFPDGSWYRVVCEKTRPGEPAKTYSVDLGNVAYLHTRNTKKIPEEVICHPIHVYCCFLENIDEIDLEKSKLLKRYENTEVDCTIIKNLNNKNYYLIKCPFLENILN
ncbi:uncharacterized protein LOC126836355 isoform X2 [Adelges cooleyi]|uniref:uncharacterized protein LOC126836355 isoform X2 n=1 Tax=Adelges cooleyi TaxID=133065 RepID=UPI00217FB7B2|nr:uncharacterized protein LOC126836355 isoform X2 [Adelges cooleyi]